MTCTRCPIMRYCPILIILLLANICLADPTDDLWKAIENMDPEAVLAACTNNAAVNAKNQHECAPIYAAVMNYGRIRQEAIGQSDIENIMERLNLVIQYLIAFGADPSGTNGHGYTAIGVAQNFKLPYLIQILESVDQPPPLPPIEAAVPSIGTEPVPPAPPLEPVLIHAATGHRFSRDEREEAPAHSQLHLLFQEHNPQSHSEEEAGFDRISLEDSQELRGTPGRLPTFRERLTGNLRNIPIAGTLFNFVSSFSSGRSTQR